MNSKNKSNKSSFKKWIPALFLLLAVIVVAVVFLVVKPGTSAGAKHITVEVIHLDQSKAVYKYSTDAEYLRQALCEETGLISGSDEAYGLWVQTVDGETADDSLQQWWGYEVNGETAMYGVDSMPVNDGDVIIFTLNVGY